MRGLTRPDRVFEGSNIVNWSDLRTGNWRVQKDALHQLLPLLQRIDIGDLQSRAKQVRATQNRAVWHMHIDANGRKGGIFIKEYRSFGMWMAIRRLLGREPAQLEWATAHGLLASGTSTYRPLALGWQGPLWGQARSFLVTREVSGTQTLLECLSEHDRQSTHRPTVLQAVGRFMALLHDRGVEHYDLHGGNLLVQLREGRASLRVVDLRRVRFGSSLGTRRRVRDLARLLHSLDRQLSRKEKEGLLSAYESLSSFSPSLRVIEALVRKKERRRLRSRTRRCLQDGTQFVRLRERRKQVFCAHDFPIDLKDRIVEEARDLHRRQRHKVLKDSPETTVTRHSFSADGRLWRVCVKRYYSRGRGDRLKYVWRRSRARRAWVAAWGLKVRGISAPEPWALIEYRHWGLPREGVVIMEDVHPSRTLIQYVSEAFPSLQMDGGRRLKAFIGTMAEFLCRLHAADVAHGDLKASNFLIRESGSGWQITLIDLDHVRFDKPVKRRERVVSLAQLNASIPGCVGAMARLRFLRLYAKDASTAALRRMAAEVTEISRKR